MARRSVAERFWPKVDVGGEDECWEWIAARYPNGYGMMGTRDGRSTMLAHRVSYELNVGLIPEGHDLHHRCANKACVNPAHLEAVPFREHLLYPDSSAGVNRRKTHCKHGHEFSPANTYVTKKGARYCRACGSASARRRRAAGKVRR